LWVVVVGAAVVVVVGATTVPVCPGAGVDFETADEPQPAASRAAPIVPNTAALECFFSISIPEDAGNDEIFPALSSRFVHLGQLTPAEQRVLGALIEKRWTTPDQYPLSLNSLRLACNQLTNRDPVTEFDEATVRDAAQRLARYGLTRLASGHGSRSVKYRHLAEEALSLDREELAVLAVLLLRGPQTPGEIKARTERMATLASLADVERVLEVLSERRYVRRMARRPGQKEDRYEQLMGGEGEGAGRPGEALPTAPAEEAGSEAIFAHDGDASSPAPFGLAPSPAADGSLEARIAALETDVAELRRELETLRHQPAC
jgi:hypothetical protein